jgi:hypothetical protein
LHPGGRDRRAGNTDLSSGQPFTTYDAEHGTNGTCGTNYNNEPWWYVACWSGSIMGGGEGSGGYPIGAYWTGSAGEWGVPDSSGANGAGNGWMFVR